MAEEQTPKIGPTGQYPAGKVSPEDRGGIACALYHRAGRIFMDFGTSLTFIAMTPAEARAFAKALREKADQVERETR